MLIEPTAGSDQEEHRSASPARGEMEVKGRNLPRACRAASPFPATKFWKPDPLNNIVTAVKMALEQYTPPELGADIAERGMMLHWRRFVA
jgi:rod shape-determining protein MreB